MFLDLNGLTVMPRPPYFDLDERSDGVGRAARKTVLAMRQLKNPR